MAQHQPDDIRETLHLYEKYQKEAEPRWPALVALVAVGGLFATLPKEIAVGPRWLVPAVVFILLVPTVTAHTMGFHKWNIRLGHLVNGIITAAMVWSIALLIRALPAHLVSPLELLVSAVSLWISNVLIFALWYWRLDAGGPHQRDQREAHTHGAFLFPQMTLDPETKARYCSANWSPNFADYLFLAFNTSTALSPTDAPVLSRWAKLLMMVQSGISLTTIVVLAARAVNIF